MLQVLLLPSKLRCILRELKLFQQFYLFNLMVPAPKLIVICDWTKIFLIFQEDCTIFFEGEWLLTTTKMHSDFTYLFNVLVGLASFIGLGVSFIGGFVGLGLVSLTVNSWA